LMQITLSPKHTQNVLIRIILNKFSIFSFYVLVFQYLSIFYYSSSY